MTYPISELIFTNEVDKELKSIVQSFAGKGVFVLMDTNTHHYCWPLLKDLEELRDAELIVLEAGEENKNLEAVSQVWKYLSDHKARRDSLLINLGGGMICDLGGFVASTFKRGMHFLNIPTTLLALVDASMGGKTGFNFNGLKNEIGVINQPEKVILCSRFLETLDRKDLLSGYAEMIKHALIYSEAYLQELLLFDLGDLDYDRLLTLIRKSVGVKKEIVLKDPMERDIRKALNFGHTIGHAFESYALERGKSLYHGFAVALGMVGELFLSVQKKGFPKEKYLQISKYLLDNYQEFSIFTGDYPTLYQLMLHDKKNNDEGVNFTLLPDVGAFSINNVCTREEVFSALDQYGKLQ